MAENWGVSPLGNLAQFEVPQFRTGEGLGAALAYRLKQQMAGQQLGQQLGESLGEAMEQRRKDQMANALADQAASYYGIDVPRGEGLGSGELRLKMMDDLFRAKQAGAKSPLELKLLQARIDRTNREPAAGGGGGGADGVTGEPRTWTAPDGTVYAITSRGTIGERISARGGATAGGATGDAGAELFKKYGLKPEELTDVTKVERVNVSKGVATPAVEGSNVRVQGGPVMPFGDYLKYARKAAAPTTQLAPDYGVPTTTTTSTRQGAGPPDAAIEKLRAHPELAGDFDAMYGAGMAQQFLGP